MYVCVCVYVCACVYLRVSNGFKKKKKGSVFCTSRDRFKKNVACTRFESAKLLRARPVGWGGVGGFGRPPPARQN